MSLNSTKPDFLVLRDDPPPAIRKEKRPVTTQLIDELRRFLRKHQSLDHKFRRPEPNEQEQMADFALRILQIPMMEATELRDHECDAATIRVAIAIHQAARNSTLLPTPDNDLWDLFTRYDAAQNQKTLDHAWTYISDFSKETKMWDVISAEQIVNCFDVYKISVRWLEVCGMRSLLGIGQWTDGLVEVELVLHQLYTMTAVLSTVLSDGRARL